ncbi:MAG TPA: FHA domain-containing protein [Thermoanaerobaculia bacterium]|nr:FHA domain-containing protein [Thermoanaerobaculia bacterium]
MERPGVVEILQRDGEVSARVRLDRLPATIGRAYDCDVILDDAYVAPHHVRIETDESGMLTAVDLGSLNGLVDPASGARATRIALGSETTVRLGRTLLRVRTAGFPVPPERLDRGRRWIERWPYAAAACALVGLRGAYEAWVDAPGPQAAATSYVTDPLGALLLLSLWAGGWALASRLFARQARFIGHLSIAATGLLALLCTGFLGDQLGFAFGSRMVSGGAYLLQLAGAGALVFAHLALIQPSRLRRMVGIAGFLTTLAVGIDMFHTYQKRGLLIDVPFVSTLSHPGLRVVRAESLEALLGRAASLKPEVDRLRDDRGGGGEPAD